MADAVRGARANRNTLKVRSRSLVERRHHTRDGVGRGVGWGEGSKGASSLRNGTISERVTQFGWVLHRSRINGDSGPN